MHRHGDTLAYDTEYLADDALLVGAGSDPIAVAVAISSAFFKTNNVVAKAMGASAVNQTIKAIAIARGHVAVKGVDLVCRPGFIDVIDDHGEKRTAIVFRLTLV